MNKMLYLNTKSSIEEEEPEVSDRVFNLSVSEECISITECHINKSNLSVLQLTRYFDTIYQYAISKNIFRISILEKALNSSFLSKESLINDYGFSDNLPLSFEKIFIHIYLEDYLRLDSDRIIKTMKNRGIFVKATDGVLQLQNLIIDSRTPTLSLYLPGFNQINFLSCIFISKIITTMTSSSVYKHCFINKINLEDVHSNGLGIISSIIRGGIHNSTNYKNKSRIRIEHSQISGSTNLSDAFRHISISACELDNLNLDHTLTEPFTVKIEASKLINSSISGVKVVGIFNSNIESLSCQNCEDTQFIGRYNDSLISTFITNAIKDLKISLYKFDRIILYGFNSQNNISLNRIIIKTGLTIHNSILDGLSIVNCDFSKITTKLHYVDFSKSTFFNTKWGHFKPHEDHKDSPLDLRESLRTIKLAYKNHSDILNYLKFYSEENRIIFKSSKHIKEINWVDRFILLYNYFTGFGVSPLKSMFALFFWSFSHFCFFVFFDNLEFNAVNFLSMIEITSAKDTEANILFNELYLFVYKAVLGSLYYQIFLSFRKFHSR